MGIAFTKEPIVRATATGSTRAALILSIAEILQDAGWSAEELSNGWRMMATSPQGFQAKIWLQDLGETMLSIYGPAISIRMSCADNDHASATQKLVAGVDRSYDVLAGVCQVFISLPEVSSEAAPDGFWGHHFAGGIPWLPEDAEGPCLNRLSTDVSSAWWLSGSGPRSFRNAHTHGNWNWAGYWSTDGLHTTGSGGHLQARVIALENHPYSAYPALPAVVYGDGEPLYLDPLIAWGQPGHGEPPKIRGQIWDAVWSTKPLNLGETFLLEEVDEETDEPFSVEFECWSYSHEIELETIKIPATWLGCLCLATGETVGGIEAEEVNYAY